ncbi:hypothetical protein DFH06DRAFT_1477321 [Mycena polygramma]|nr:hypothetical protein DFH06DRAFT_1477321 [Mycena polygramma]
MPRLRHSLASLTGYRLGYSPQRPYPWRWATPVGLLILLTSSALLACLNVPLSAYDIVQEFTYFPNATVAPLPLSNMVPAFLRAPPATFAPQTLHLDDTFRLNNSLFSYTIVSAFDAADHKTPVSSFPYYNNPFSHNCDVTSITARVTRTLGESSIPYQYYGWNISGLVSCTSPTVFQMTWGLPMIIDDLFRPTSDEFALDLQEALYYGLLGGSDGGKPYGAASVEVTVRPCCNCTGTIETTSDEDLEVESRRLLEPPCSTEPARFIGRSGSVFNTTAVDTPWGYGYNWNGSNITDLFAGMDPQMRMGYIGSNDLSVLNAPFLNLFQIFYHLVRRDLGTVVGNQIWTSAEMFNQSITPQPIPQEIIGDIGTPFGKISSPAADTYRAAFSNGTFLAQLQNSSRAFDGLDHVPVLEYLRPVPRPKPLGSAITSVFVATFAMVSTVWTIFCIVATAFVRSNDATAPTKGDIFHLPLYEAFGKRNSDGIEGEEASPLKAADTELYTDDRLEFLIKRMNRMEDELRDMRRDYR